MQSVRPGSRADASQFDERRAREARLRGAVNRDGIGDERQGRGGENRSAAGGEVEADRVGAGQRVRVENGLTQGAGSGIVGDGDGEVRATGDKRRKATDENLEKAFAVITGDVLIAAFEWSSMPANRCAVLFQCVTSYHHPG